MQLTTLLALPTIYIIPITFASVIFHIDAVHHTIARTLRIIKGCVVGSISTYTYIHTISYTHAYESRTVIICHLETENCAASSHSMK